MAARVTKWVLLTTATALVIYNVVLLATGTNEGLISRVLLGSAMDWFSVPLVFGIVTGHLFMPVQKIRDRVMRLVVLWVVFAAAVTFDVFLESFRPAPAVALLVGCGLGALLWPQLVPRSYIMVP